MQLRLAKTLLGLLACSPLFRPAQAYPYAGTDATLTGESTPIQAASDIQHVSLVDTTTYPRTKRAVPVPFQMVHPNKYLELTWSGIVKEPVNSGWTRDTIKAYAQEGWRQTQATGPRQITLVSALWIPGRGVYLGSIPHALRMADKEHVEIAFETLAGNTAPLVWNQISCRERSAGSIALWHAEDMAMTIYEQAEKPRDRYPTGAYMATFGQYKAADSPSSKDPCGLSRDQDPDTKTPIVPTCKTVLVKLSISF